MVDGTEGVHTLDEMVVNMLRQKEKPFQLVVNKIDSDGRESLLYDFYRLGIQNIIGISASHGRNVDMLLDEIIKHIPEARQDRSLQRPH